MLHTPSTEDLAPPFPEGSSEAEIAGVRPFAPRQDADRKGIVVKAAPSPRMHAERTEVVLAELIRLVRLATDWPASDADLESRIGDYRYLILKFGPAPDQERYVQIWSEPIANLAVEVGPGEPRNRALKALMARQTAQLHGRGFKIGGGARNFTKSLPTPRSDDDVKRVASELLGLLTDVLGYKGTVDLDYALRQSTHLKSAYVTGPMPREVLAALLSAWGLHAEQLADDATTIRSHSHDFDFTLHLTSPSKQSPNCYWEIHCGASFPVPSDKAADILHEVNARTWLLKACEIGTFESQTLLNFAYGINLGGGVTLEHIKSQLFEWISDVHHFRRKARETDTVSMAPVSGEQASSTVH